MTLIEEYGNKYSSFKYLNCYGPEIEFFGYQFELLQKYIDGYDFNRLTCLDLGCGFGIKTYYLSQKFKQVVGADFIENIVNVNKLLNDNRNLEFIVYDFNSDSKLEEKFDCVTALGFSMLNIKDVSKYISNIEKIFELTNENGVLIIWSFSDFSGKAPSGWYNHSKNELNEIVSLLKKNYKHVDLIYPYNKVALKDFFSIKGLKRIIRFFLRKKYYFLIINK